MHGLVNMAVQGFVTDTYGERAWLAVARGSGAEIADFESLTVYDDRVTEQLLVATEAVLERRRPDVLENIGIWLIAKRQPATIRRLLRFGGLDFADFVQSLYDLPDRVRLAVPNLVLPAIDVEQTEAGDFRIRLTGPRGFGHVLMGVLRAMSDDYGTLAMIWHDGPCPEGEALTVEIFDETHSEGRQFRLGEAIS